MSTSTMDTRHHIAQKARDEGIVMLYSTVHVIKEFFASGLRKLSWRYQIPGAARFAYFDVCQPVR